MSDKKTSNEEVRTVPRKNFLFKMVFGFLLVLVLLIAGLWIWSGGKGSLATALSFVQGCLPVKSLIISDTQASLRNGGHIGNIHIEQNDGSSVTLNDVNADWNLLDLLKKQLIIQQFSIHKVHVMGAPARTTDSEETPQKPALSEEPASLPKPPEQIVLPVHIDLKQLHIDQVVQGEKEQEIASNIQLSYQFDGSKHSLSLNSAHFADGNYQGNLTLTARQPELDASFKGVLTTQIPQSNQDVSINADTIIHGPLTLLNIVANAQAATNAANSSKFALQATVAPWAAVKIPEADLDLQAFNARAFWAQSPQTLLSGTVKISSTAQEKADIALDLKNTIPGAVDLSKVPVSAITGTLTTQDHQIVINRLNIHMSSGTATITGQAQLPQSASSPPTWKANIQLTSIDPHGIYSQIASDRLSGTIALAQETANTIGFDANITAANGSNVPLFGVRHLVTQGTFFVNNRVVLNSVTASSVDARVQGQSISYALNNGAVSGPLQFTAPGLEADVMLDAFAKTAGSARLVLDIQDVEQAAGWLGKQPIQLGQLPDFLAKVSRYTQNLSSYVKNIPVTLHDGWEKPHVQVELDLNTIITKIMEQEGKDKLLERLGVPQKSQEEGESPRQQIEREAIDRLGDLLNRKK